MHVYISGLTSAFLLQRQQQKAHISNSYQLESGMNAFGQLLFSVSHPSAAWYIKECDWNSFNTVNFSISLPAAFAFSLVFCI